MNDPRAVSRLWTSVSLAALLCGCEGATYVDHRVVNDTLWVEGRVLTVDLMDDSLWQVQVDEGLTWIRFEQELTVVPSHFD